jgi:hypothetical protein
MTHRSTGLARGGVAGQERRTDAAPALTTALTRCQSLRVWAVVSYSPASPSSMTSCVHQARFSAASPVRSLVPSPEYEDEQVRGMIGYEKVGSGALGVIVLNDWICDTSTWDGARAYLDEDRFTWASSLRSPIAATIRCRKLRRSSSRLWSAFLRARRDPLVENENEHWLTSVEYSTRARQSPASRPEFTFAVRRRTRL